VVFLSFAPKPSAEGITRRDLLTQMGKGLLAVAAGVSGQLITPAEARARAIPLRNFSVAEGQTLEALGRTLLPGAAEAGIAHYIDDQLSSETPLLFLKYMDYAGGYSEFYKQGLESLNRESLARFGQPFALCAAQQNSALVGEISQKNPASWTGPPAPLFYFVLRNDAVDVYYGTPQGFQKLGVPYMAMIDPPKTW
jgi:Gluconate 2-dehydrogenase subunit 3